jgi:hypothetical protein
MKFIFGAKIGFIYWKKEKKERLPPNARFGAALNMYDRSGIIRYLN